MTVVGFTGTRKGMTDRQKFKVQELLERFNPSEVHHGECVGSDLDFHLIVQKYFVTAKIFGHPASGVGDKKAKLLGFYKEFPPKPPLERNKDIADLSQIVLATPSGVTEIVRSGTWSTIRYCWRSDKKVTIIYPDGSVYNAR